MNIKYPRLVIAGTNSGVGKTTLALGLILALKKQGLKVQAFKAGPDYIDPSYHTLASARPCRNLDTWMLSQDAVLELFQRSGRDCDISLIEGVMGLYDGLADKDNGSSAHLAKILRSPVILVLDSRSLSRSAAAIVLGYKEFDKTVDLRGVILNNIVSQSHYQSIKSAIQKHTGLPVLGYLPKDKSLVLGQRHLGLIPAQEKKPQGVFLKKVLRLVEATVDLKALLAIARSAADLPDFQPRLFAPKPKQSRINIAIAQDAAFNFYYQDNLDLLNHYGANLIAFSPIKDKQLPKDIHGIYIGGGFPELFAGKLARNMALKNDIFQRAKSGMPIYAECAGLMYLTKELIDFKEKSFPMAGIFNAWVQMGKRLAGLGYVNIEVIRNNILSAKAGKIRAHLFHWSYIKGLPRKTNFAYKLKKKNRQPIMDGLLKWNVLASYAHLHFAASPRLAKNFIHHCQAYAKN